MDYATQLRNVLPNLTERDQAFANSLLAGYDRYGNFTARQQPYVEQLINRAADRIANPQTAGTVVLASMSGVIALFNRARQHIKAPKIELQLRDGRPLSLAVAGSRSKFPGYVTVTDGGPYGSNIWYGRISPEGEWTPGRTAENNPALATEIRDLLNELAADPAGVAAAHGRLTGRCCFCHGKRMTDERSIAVGYGKVCAKNFGVPWGKTRTHTVFRAEAA